MAKNVKNDRFLLPPQLRNKLSSRNPGYSPTERRIQSGLHVC